MIRALIDQLSDAQVVGLTLYGEARNQGPEGRIAVANVIRNRAKAKKAAFGFSPRLVCLKPLQFSCWNDGDDANHLLLTDTARHLLAAEQPGPVLRECLWIADGLLADAFVDNTHGASHYLTTELLERKPPAWAVNQRVLATINSHAFLRVA